MGAASSSDPGAALASANSAGKDSEGRKKVQTYETRAHQFQVIRDRFETTEEVTEALREAGLEASDLILAVDLTGSNNVSGKESFNGTLYCTSTRFRQEKG
jgi:hypothetical protein